MTHTVSRELSERLWKKGLRIDSEKWWVKKGIDIFVTHKRSKYSTLLYFAPSSDELLAVMPETIEVGKDYHLEILKVDNQFVVGYRNFYADILRGEGAPCITTTFDKYLPEALGLMCEWLLDNGYTYNEVKKCLVKGG